MSWDLGVPNLGGGYLADALSNAGENFDKLAGSVGGLIMRGKTADQTLATLHQSGQLPDNVYQSVMSKGVGAKEQILGMYGSSIAAKLQEKGKAAGQYEAMKEAGVPMFNPNLLNQFPAGPNGQTPPQQALPGTDTTGVVPSPAGSTVKRAQPAITPSQNAQNIPVPQGPTGAPTVYSQPFAINGKMMKAPMVNGAPQFNNAIPAE